MKSRTKDVLLNVVVLLVTLLILVFILEGASRMVFGKNLRYEYPEDTLWQLEPNQTGFSLPNGVFSTINSGGFRGEEVSLKRVEGVDRLVLLGGSIGFGWGVEDNETLAVQLEKDLLEDGRKTEVLNLGEAGYGIFQMIAKYNKVGAQYNPDVVLLLFASTNILAQPDVNKANQIKSMLARKLLRKSTLAAYLKPKLGFLRYYITGVKVNETAFLDEWPKDAERILEFRDDLEAQGKELVLLPYPYKPEHDFFYQYVVQFGKANNIRVTGPIHEAIAEYKKTGSANDLVVEDGHPSGLQFSIASNIVKETIEELI